jgi:CRISPR-associated protein Csx17
MIHYLKALGIFRLVAEQCDPRARGAWRGDAFMLETEQSCDDLMTFFLEKYQPTPIVAPWNGGSGFYPQDKSQRAHLDRLCAIQASRLADYRATITTARVLVGERREQPKDEAKADVLRQARCAFSDRALKWLDAAFVLGDAKPDYPPVLGSGGNDGRLDFTINFVQRLLAVLPEAIAEERAEQFKAKAGRLTSDKLDKLKKKLEQKCRERTEQSHEQLRAALFRDRVVAFEKAAVGMFYPAGAGGANATQGVIGDSYVNPWDFILAIEGTLLLASATVRQLAAGARSRASFPFTARNSAVGYGTAVSGEKMRAEIWLPLWSRSASFAEVGHIFGEGRVQFSGAQKRLVRSGFDFARAVAELGVDRGIDAFQRYGFIERNGQANLAAPLGRFEVRERPRAALLYEVDRWLDLLRRATSDAKRTPPRLIRARTNIEEAAFNLCASGEREHLQATIIALGEAENDLARSAKFRDEHGLRPLSGLSDRWANECDDGSFEFEAAAALASIVSRDGGNAFRTNLEPVRVVAGNLSWTSEDTCAVWGTGALADNLAALLNRRSIDARAAGVSHPMMWNKRFASLAAIDAFLRSDTADERFEDLLRGLALINWQKSSVRAPRPYDDIPPSLPRPYALLKLLFLPDGRLSRHGHTEPVIIRHEPVIVPLLRAGRIDEALGIAYRRLRSTGLVPLTDQFHFPPDDGARLAAALLIPIGARAVTALARVILRPASSDAAA